MSEDRHMNWIAVKDDLPKDPREVCLVCWSSFDGDLFYGTARLCLKWQEMLLWHGYCGSHNAITHWIPIQPPTP